MLAKFSKIYRFLQKETSFKSLKKLSIFDLINNLYWYNPLLVYILYLYIQAITE